MAIVKLLSRGWHIIKKGVLVLRRDGIKGGLKRGAFIYKEWRRSQQVSPITTALFDVKAVPYQKKNGILQVKVGAVPEVSVIIPVFNGLDYVKECMDSIFSAPVRESIEVIVVDQNSTDGTRELLRGYAREHSNYVLIENEENVGFARAMNQGASVAKGQYIVLGNSDLIFPQGWLDPLVDTLRQDLEVGIVSPMTNYVGEGPQIDPEAAGIKPAEVNDYARKVSTRTTEVYATDRLVFFCVLIRKNLYDLLGGLASIYALGNYEDDDFCLRARLAGYTLKIASNSFVFHYGSKTFIRQRINYEEVMIRNEKLFFQRVVDFSLGLPLHSRQLAEKIQVSVVLRTRNRRHLLRQALASLANQTYRDFEVVVVNDGDVDISDLAAFFGRFMHLKVVRNAEGGGRGGALNLGLNEARGEWITYLDDDDLVYPTHLENLTAEFTRHPQAALVYTDANKSLCWVDDAQENIVPLARERFVQQGFDFENLLVDNWIPIMSFIHRRDDALALGGYDQSLDVFEDWDFLLRLTRGREVRRVPRLTCEYRIRFAGKPDDSTLRDRERARGFREEIYRRYAPEMEQVVYNRAVTMEVVELQMANMARINALPVSDLQRNYLVAASLGAFRTVGDRLELSTG